LNYKNSKNISNFLNILAVGIKNPIAIPPSDTTGKFHDPFCQS